MRTLIDMGVMDDALIELRGGGQLSPHVQEFLADLGEELEARGVDPTREREVASALQDLQREEAGSVWIWVAAGAAVLVLSAGLLAGYFLWWRKKAPPSLQEVAGGKPLSVSLAANEIKVEVRPDFKLGEGDRRDVVALVPNSQDSQKAAVLIPAGQLTAWREQATESSFNEGELVELPVQNKGGKIETESFHPTHIAPDWREFVKFLAGLEKRVKEQNYKIQGDKLVPLDGKS